MLDEFEFNTNNGIPKRVVPPPLAASVKMLRRMRGGDPLHLDLIRWILNHFIAPLDFLHTEVNVIHTVASTDIIVF